MSELGRRRSPGVRVALGGLLGIVALNALGGGIYALTGAEAVPVEWLEGTPFSSYTLPGIVLLVGVGGSAAAAAAAVLTRTRFARPAALAAGAILLVWISVQVALIGYVSWLQPTMAVVAALIIALALLLPESVPRSGPGSAGWANRVQGGPDHTPPPAPGPGG